MYSPQTYVYVLTKRMKIFHYKYIKPLTQIMECYTPHKPHEPTAKAPTSAGHRELAAARVHINRRHTPGISESPKHQRGTSKTSIMYVANTARPSQHPGGTPATSHKPWLSSTGGGAGGVPWGSLLPSETFAPLKFGPKTTEKLALQKKFE